MPEDPLKHRPLLRSVAKRYLGVGRRCGLDLDDLMQEGWFGLDRACERFDPARGAAFSTYATLWITEAISKAIRNQARPIRLPQWVRTQLNKGASPDDPSLTPSRRECLKAAIRILGAEREDEGLFPLVAAEETETEADDDGFKVIAPRLAELESRDQMIITKRFGLDGSPAMSRTQIGRTLSLTGERVRQLEVKAMAQLRTGA